MPILEFKEIPEAHIANGLQDTFELFARDFLQFMGYRIIYNPDRGPDGGKDLIVEELRTGVGGETAVRWLVSCKHKATSERSVSAADDANINDRVKANQCHGFMGFYSTLASSGLANILDGLGNTIEHQVLDREKIEAELLHSTKGLEIVQRYFPHSFKSWKAENPQPAKVFADKPTLKCKICQRELLEQDDKGIVTLWQEMKGGDYTQLDSFKHVVWTCRSHCDRILKDQMHAKNLIDGWNDISDVMTPTIFIKWIMSIMNELRSGVSYSDEAFDSLKEFLLQLYPFVARHLTDDQKGRIHELAGVPAYLGGLGYQSEDDK